MRTHPTADVHPWTIRLFVDVDPAGNPIGKGGVLFEQGQERATLWFEPPGPFDSLADAFADLTVAYVDYIGLQQTLF